MGIESSGQGRQSYFFWEMDSTVIYSKNIGPGSPQSKIQLRKSVFGQCLTKFWSKEVYIMAKIFFQMKVLLLDEMPKHFYPFKAHQFRPKAQNNPLSVDHKKKPLNV